MFSQNKVPRMQSSEEAPGYISSSGMRMSMSAHQAPVVPAQHGYPIVQYVGGREPFFFYNQGPQLYRQGPGAGSGGYYDPQAESQVTACSVVSSEENVQRSPGVASHRSAHHNNSHQTWLKDNLEVTREGSLSRLCLYEGYVSHCRETTLEPLNQPSFGKLIHSVFPNIKARRLGTRGNSRYHYYGVRVKPNSPLGKLQEDPLFHNNVTGQHPIKQEQDCMSDQPPSEGSQNAPEPLEAAQSRHHLQQFTQMSCELPPFPDLDHLRRQSLLVEKLQNLYRKNCVAVLDAVKSLQFHGVETLWRSFWCPTVTVPSGDGATAVPDRGEAAALEGVVPRDSLVALCQQDAVRAWMRSCDRILYGAMVEFLMPDVVCQVPADRIRDVRDFADGVEGWMTNAMTRDFPPEVVGGKAEAVRAFAQMLRQYVGLNDLAQAARSHLQKPSTVNKMLADLHKVDVANLQKQASWVCRCDAGVFRLVEQNLKAALTRQQQSPSGDQWATWLDAVVSRVLRDKGLEDARQFLLRWSYYSSMVVRDLTLRSAATYGPCHVVCMFYDEYMLYLVARHAAKVTQQPAIAVIGEFNDLIAAPPGNN